MKVAVVKYNAGNVRSVLLALERLGVDGLLTADPLELQQADKVIFPGVGAAHAAMEHLQQTGLDKLLSSLKQPVLGICLGMQLLVDASEEGPTSCLGIMPGEVKRFPDSVGKVPQMGWNLVRHNNHPLFDGLPSEVWMYHVHGYYLAQGPNTIATTHYGFDYSSALARQNFYAVQFHPERSGPQGSRLLQNFLHL